MAPSDEQGSLLFGKRHKEVKEVLDSKNVSPNAERIKEEVCKKCGMAMDELHRSRRGISNEPRNGAICLVRSLRGDNLEEIGREFNISRFSSVSSVVERMRATVPKRHARSEGVLLGLCRSMSYRNG